MNGSYITYHAVLYRYNEWLYINYEYLRHQLVCWSIGLEHRVENYDVSIEC